MIIDQLTTYSMGQPHYHSPVTRFLSSVDMCLRRLPGRLSSSQALHKDLLRISVGKLRKSAASEGGNLSEITPYMLRQRFKRGLIRDPITHALKYFPKYLMNKNKSIFRT